MRPTTTTTVVTYGILMLAGGIPLAMPDHLASPVIPAYRSAASERANRINTTELGQGYWQRGNSAASSMAASPFISSD